MNALALTATFASTEDVTPVVAPVFTPLVALDVTVVVIAGVMA